MSSRLAMSPVLLGARLVGSTPRSAVAPAAVRLFSSSPSEERRPAAVASSAGLAMRPMTPAAFGASPVPAMPPGIWDVAIIGGLAAVIIIGPKNVIPKVANMIKSTREAIQDLETEDSKKSTDKQADAPAAGEKKPEPPTPPTDPTKPSN
ncbi:hypothetical protein H696_03070 [Fonticula alba]|uniref:Uncharacterized protein n=1 Tax=Fonticula alba TaxID=691883 RepID=A0A058Z9V6_FONAL|nr:hypothetical protein H696_03070 [Fonticula alba]KCV70718.1 hypothetical protein H696_03070 [Fonticula alba]|eukprot:XP_009495234.1 hypothetical protein H696_03070 [Fonticula alba]